MFVSCAKHGEARDVLPGTRANRGRDATRAGRSRRRRTRARVEPADASRRETQVRSVLFDASRGADWMRVPKTPARNVSAFSQVEW